MSINEPLPKNHGNDVSEWLEAGHTVDELQAIISNAPLWTENGTMSEEVSGADHDSSLALVKMSDVVRELVSWLWFPYIALGKLTIIEGEEGLGKSWMVCSFAASVSTGNGFPPSFERVEPGNILILSAEDGLADTIKPRLDSCRADTTRIFAVPTPLTLDGQGLIQLESYIIETSPKLVIIDPLFAYTPTRIDINSANQSRSIATPLASLATKYNCAFLLVRHIGKAKGYGDARAAGLGSIDWRAAVRSVLLVGKNPDNDYERALVQTKNNLAPFGDAIGFKIEGTIDGAMFFWTGASNLTASRILANVSDDATRSEQLDAIDFLREALHDGEQKAKILIAQAEEFGITRKQLRTAREKLGVTIKKRGGGFGKNNKQHWTWKLTDAPVEGVLVNEEDAHAEDQGQLPLSDSSDVTYSGDLTEDALTSTIGHLQPNDPPLLEAACIETEGHLLQEPDLNDNSYTHLTEDAPDSIEGHLLYEREAGRAPSVEEVTDNDLDRMFDQMLHGASDEVAERMLFEYEERVAIIAEDESLSDEQARHLAKHECLTREQDI